MAAPNKSFAKYRAIYDAGERYLELHRLGLLRKKTDVLSALSNKWYRLNALYIIRNKAGKLVRFSPNAQQRDRFITGHTRDIILKVRQLGFTTFEMIDSLDDCLFTSNVIAGCICHSLKDANDIFENKVKLAYKELAKDKEWQAIFKQCGVRFPKPLSDKGGAYKFDNGSSIHVATSYRGGTLSRLHVSEFGKICRKYPDKAKEIVTGAFEAVPTEGRITLESTAEGRTGYFFDYTDKARKKLDSGKQITKLDWLFHFYPWWQEPAYTMDPEGVTIPSYLLEYFAELQAKHGIRTTASQQAWYAMKAETLQDAMMQEYPSHPDEAFDQQVQGAFYGKQMRELRRRGGITTKVVYNPQVPVYTAWDLGMNDAMCIVFFQKIGREFHIIDYVEASGEGFEYYARILFQERKYIYGAHYGPHDVMVRELGTGTSRVASAQSYGIHFTPVARIKAHTEGINAVRLVLPRCYFAEVDSKAYDAGDDQDGVMAEHVNQTDRLIDCLDNYRKEWDDRLGVYKSTPRHDWASHGSKAFETFARSAIVLGDDVATAIPRESNTRRAKSAWGAHT